MDSELIQCFINFSRAPLHGIGTCTEQNVALPRINLDIWIGQLTKHSVNVILKPSVDCPMGLSTGRSGRLAPVTAVSVCPGTVAAFPVELLPPVARSGTTQCRQRQRTTSTLTIVRILPSPHCG